MENGKYLAAALLFLTANVTAAPPTEPFFDRHMWSDGKAEVNLYDATEVRYGVARKATEAVLIFVKEDHRAADMVKADDASKADLPAVKLNWSVEVPTGIYTYRQQASVFLNRKTNVPFRETFASHEWCGNTWKDLRWDGTKCDYKWSSYFGDEADGDKQLKFYGATPDSKSGVLFSDALPAIVRTLQYDELGNGDGKWYGATGCAFTLWSNRATPDAISHCVGFNATGGHKTTVPAGTFTAWRIVAHYTDNVEDVYYVEDGPQRRLLKMQRADGAVYELRKSMRVDYWNHHDPGEESLKQGAGVK
ncbi:MAG: hypothetical protein GC159_12320 [Phycisphaera sp.]|nr:hypothetical protein [Phycisphaera sp.]